MNTNYEEISRANWLNADLGDERLNKRAVYIGADFLRNPFTSPPKMLQEPSKIKAFYRFMDNPKICHEGLTSSHINNTLAGLSKHKIILCIQDQTTITFCREDKVKGSYDVGNIHGVVVHNGISVIPYENYGIIDGLLYQKLHRRKPKKQRMSADNEIHLWTDCINCVGKPPAGTTIIDVADRGADVLEVMQASKDCGHEFIIRATHDRLIIDEQYKSLLEFARKLPTSGLTSLHVQKKVGQKKRNAKLRVAFSKVHLKSPKNKSEVDSLQCSIVHVLEQQPPSGQEPLEWFILMSLEVNNLSDALKVTRYYSYRWIIEEYHKCLKTGFRIEKTQLETVERIENLLGFISVSSVPLLQMRDIVRHDPKADALKYVTSEDIMIVKAYYKIKEEKMSIDCFLRYIAQMGGFLNRKNDGNPGWQSLWEGWKFFLTLKRGVTLFQGGEIYG